MSFTVKLSSPDLYKQIQALEEYPEIMDRHFRPAMKSSVQLVGGEIRPNIPVLSGRALARFRTSISGKGLKITGRIGWWGTDQPWYINVVEYGARAHHIGYVPALDLVVDHPGMPAREFMKHGYETTKPVVDANMAFAAERVVADLAIARGRA